ncbi:MAG: tail fiber domain-containing protein [Rhodothermales bacterium]
MKNFHHHTTFILIAISLLAGLNDGARAQFSGAYEGMSFQGYLTDDGDVPINGTKDITVGLYDASSSGTEVWERTYFSVSVVDGIFNFILTDGTPVMDLVSFAEPRWLQFEVDGEVVGSRTELTSAPYALSLRNLRVIPRVGNDGPSLLGGYLGNTISGGVVGATISGGGASAAMDAGKQSVIGDYGTIGGGYGNRAGTYATVAGGSNNTADASHAYIGGGFTNTASGSYTTIGGGEFSYALGYASTVPGGLQNYAGGAYSFVAGDHAKTRNSAEAGDSDGDEGTFVWSDRSNTASYFQSTGPNQFLIEAAGGVGINTNAPAAHLHIAKANNSTGGGVVIEANEQDRLYMYFVADDDMTIGTYRGSDGRRLPIALQPNGGNVGIGTTSPSEKLEVNGNVLANNVAVPSDARYKKNIQPIVGPLGLLSKLNGVRYEYDRDAHPEKSFEAGVQLGLIAQDVQKILPELVHENGAGYLSVNYIGVIPVLVEAIKEQEVLISKRDAQIDALSGEMRIMRERLDQLTEIVKERFGRASEAAFTPNKQSE